MKPTLIFLIVLLLSACNHDLKEGDDLVISNPFQVNFNSTPPKDLSATANDTMLLNFAWEEFIALNWKSSYSTDNKRDNPDNSWSWSNSDPDLLVWETYAHRAELRPANDSMQPFDNPPHYDFNEPLSPVGSASFTLFNALDENNEIGSADIYAHVDTEQKSNMVLYQAKVNKDEYQYIYDTYPTTSALESAVAQTKSNIDNYKAYYSGASSSCNCPIDSNVVCLPCGGATIPGGSDTYTGAIETKTAWRRLNSQDDSTKYLRRTVIVFEKDNNGNVVYDNVEYALIGIHIIHKTENYNDFIFATWEHKSVESDNMGYVLLNNGQEVGPLYPNYPRLHPITQLADSSTASVHAQIAAKNPNSVWLNYRLVGVQGHPSNDTSSFNFFLANYVIESDTALADFHGSSLANPHDGLPNILFNGQLLSQGGCQGCHGATQLGGSDFSFLLAGSGAFDPDIVTLSSSTTVSKLERFMKSK